MVPRKSRGVCGYQTFDRSIRDVEGSNSCCRTTAVPCRVTFHSLLAVVDSAFVGLCFESYPALAGCPTCQARLLLPDSALWNHSGWGWDSRDVDAPSQYGGRLDARGPMIRIRGARTHNLRDIDLDIPRDQLIVITGPSGSGKSSLAFDTLYAEGQRQYVESLSVYARHFLHQLQRPDVDLIEGLPPTICIDQRPGHQGRRSTVATATEIYDHLRLLMARIGQIHCYQCGARVHQQSAEQIQAQIMELPEGTKTMVLAPLVRGRRGAHKDVLAQIRKARLVRVRVDGDVYDLENVPPLAPQKTHDVDAVIDRVIIRPGVRSRVADSVSLAVEQSGGLVSICYLTPEAESRSTDNSSWQTQLYSTHHACSQCNINYEEIQPRTFSFNSPYGACPVCEGMGVLEQFDPELVVPSTEWSLLDGAVAAWKNASTSTMKKCQPVVTEYLKGHGADWNTPLCDLGAKTRDQLLHGDDKKFVGVLMLLEQEYSTTTSKTRLAQLGGFRASMRCDACAGSRLRVEAMSVRLAGRAIHEIAAMTVDEAVTFFDSVEFTSEEDMVAEPLVREIRKRLEFLQRVGVTYLTLDRPTETLSGGELQRVRLATSIGSGLVGVCYILDEPSIGLHSRDNYRLIESLRELQRQGNTVIVVEHDEAVMREADRVIDVGPKAGQGGGRIVAEGSIDEVSSAEESMTGRYLAGTASIPTTKKQRRTSKTRSLHLEGATINNLKDVDVRIPLGALVCVTGVSGSGKSSLINETLGPAIISRLGGAAPKPGPHKSLRGVTKIEKVVQIDQSPIGRTPRSNPATYTGVYDEIRKVFAGTREAKQRGFKARRFSFNVKGGRCEACQGQGAQKVEMSFLPDMYVPCDECHGARFNRQTLRVQYRGRSIADVLEMRIEEGADFFENFVNIARVLQSLRQVGLGYVPLGQPSTTLSGGEAQRIKLATELARVESGKTLYLLDEPTTGLHFEDIRRLLEVLSRLVDKGNTVVVIEHNLDVIKCADWIIDMGPEGGEAGGEVVAVGTPAEVAASDASHTGRFLHRRLVGEQGLG